MNKKAQVYVQYDCDIEDDLEHNRRIGFFVTATFSFITMLYLVLMFEMEISSQIKYRNWDFNTVTPADFTLKFTFSQDIWDKWMNSSLKAEMSFKDYLINEIQD